MSSQYVVHSRELVERIKELTGDTRLCNALIWDFGDKEYHFIGVLLEGKFTDARQFWEVRRLYAKYQEECRRYHAEHSGRPYTALAELSPDRRTWDDDEHVFVHALLLAEIDAEGLWHMKHAYAQFKRARALSNRGYIPVGQAFVVDRKWAI